MLTEIPEELETLIGQLQALIEEQPTLQDRFAMAVLPALIDRDADPMTVVPAWRDEKQVQMTLAEVWVRDAYVIAEEALWEKSRVGSK